MEMATVFDDDDDDDDGSDSDSDSSMEASRNTDAHRSPTRANKPESSPSSHGPGYREPRGKAERGLVDSVMTQTSATAASTLPLNSLSDCTSTTKSCLCVMQSGYRRIRGKKGSRYKKNPYPAHRVMWRRGTLHCIVRSRKHFGHHAPTVFLYHPNHRQQRWSGHFCSTLTPCLHKQAPREKLPSLYRPTLGCRHATPTTRPTTTQSSRELPPNRLLPCTPPATSQAAWKAGTGLESAPNTAECYQFPNRPCSSGSLE